MKKNILILFVAVSTVLFSCQNSDDDGNNYPSVTTGVTGVVKYGMGACDTSGEGHPNDYQLYNGTLYFIPEYEVENTNEEDFEELKANSMNGTVFNGSLAMQLPAGTYVVMPSEFYIYTVDNTVTVEEGVVSEKNLQFWNCTSN